MLRAWLLYNKCDADINSESIRMFCEYGRLYDIDVKLIIISKLSYSINKNIEFIYDGMFLDKPDIVINRSRNYELSVLFESCNIKVFNSSKVTLYGNNKLLSYALVSSLGIDILKTFSSAEIIDDFPVVEKSRDGHGGKDVKLINEAMNLNRNEKYIYQQKATDGNNDLRVYIIGNEILCAMLRTSDNDFRSNFSMGGRASVYEISPQIASMVDKIIYALGETGYCGIDFILDNGKWKFNEIEDAVGARMVYSFTKLDPIKMYIEYIYNQMCNLN